LGKENNLGRMIGKEEKKLLMELNLVELNVSNEKFHNKLCFTSKNRKK
jgi:hypothetical protein